MSDLLARNQRACTVQAKLPPGQICEGVLASVLQSLANNAGFSLRRSPGGRKFDQIRKQNTRIGTQVCEFRPACATRA